MGDPGAYMQSQQDPNGGNINMGLQDYSFAENNETKFNDPDNFQIIETSMSRVKLVKERQTQSPLNMNEESFEQNPFSSSHQRNISSLNLIDKQNSGRKGDKRANEIENANFGLIENDPKIKKSFFQQLIITKQNKWKSFLDIFMIILAVYSTFTSTYYAAFGLETSIVSEIISISVEVLFGVDIILNFFTEYISEEDFYPVRDHKKIAIRYFKRSFIFDMLSVIPFRYFINDSETRQLFTLFKILRLPKLFLLLDSRNFKQIVKTYYDGKLNRVLKNASMKHDQLQDNNNIMLQIMINYAFRVFRLVVVIFSISYFIGTLWYIFTWQIDDPTDTRPDINFFRYYKMDEKKKNNEDIDSMITVVYFAFTTLATVGYGDYHAVNDIERIICSIILLFGVAVFSFIMGNFIEILMSFKIVTAENEESENLTKWLGLLARFNKGRPLPKDMTRKIENYFDYYWAQDRNYAIKSEEDLRFMQELPKQIRISIFREFLFKNFLYLFRSYFTITRDIQELIEGGDQKKSKNYGWADTQYASFMVQIMQSLEPRKYMRNEMILMDLDEVDEVTFVCTGEYGVGYQLNNQQYLSIKIGQKSVIGDYSVVFHKRSEFLYKALTDMDCYGLRKNRLYQIFDKYKEYSGKMKKKITERYNKIVRKNVLEHKEETLEQIKRINKFEFSGHGLMVINPLDEEKELKKEMESKAGESQAAMRRVKKLEQKVERLGTAVYGLFQKYDNQINELISI
eukprot:403346494